MPAIRIAVRGRAQPWKIAMRRDIFIVLSAKLHNPKTNEKLQ